MPLRKSQVRSHVEAQGFAVIPDVIGDETVIKLRTAVELLGAECRKPGIRAPLAKSRLLCEFAASAPILGLAEDMLGKAPCIVRSILFTKSPDANWDVASHQDTTIAVQNRKDAPGFGPWSLKDGTPHVRPPASILDQMISVRVHLDDTDHRNGALYVVPGSHRRGIIPEVDIAAHAKSGPVEICEVPAGGLC